MTADVLQFRPRDDPPEPPRESAFDVLVRTNDVDAFARAVRAGGGKCTDGHWPEFERGWAFIAFASESQIIHYWRPRFRVSDAITPAGRAGLWTALCGFEAASQERAAPILRPGNFPRCKVCQRKNNKGIR